jgi:hypothetical protein
MDWRAFWIKKYLNSPLFILITYIPHLGDAGAGSRLGCETVLRKCGINIQQVQDGALDFGERIDQGL